MCSQASQRVRCPSSAALRQRSMADHLQLSETDVPRFASRQAGPWSRKISATSSRWRATMGSIGGRYRLQRQISSGLTTLPRVRVATWL